MSWEACSLAILAIASYICLWVLAPGSAEGPAVVRFSKVSCEPPCLKSSTCFLLAGVRRDSLGEGESKII